MTTETYETTPHFLCRRTRLHVGTLHKRLRHKDCPPWHAVKTDSRGRVWRLAISKATLEWLLRPLNEAKRTNRKPAAAVL